MTTEDTATSASTRPPWLLLRLWGVGVASFAAAFSAPALVALIEGNAAYAGVFGGCGLATAAVGLVWRKSSRVEPADHDVTLGRTVALVWLSLSAVAAVPLFLIAGLAPPASEVAAAYGSPARAWFEAISGLTSTGLSVSGAASELPASVQLWRSLLQWLGGFSVLAFIMALSDRHDHHAEAVQLELAAAMPDSSARRRVWTYVGIYAGLTAICGVAFALTEMRPWEALNHALTAISTGGFSVRDDSFASYGWPARSVALTATVLGALSFTLHVRVLNGRGGASLHRSSQHRVFLAALLAYAGWSAIAAAFTGTAAPGDAVFEAVSAVGTCGYNVGGSHASWSSALLAPLVVAMVFGAASGSTSGGVKQNRLAWLLKAASRLSRGGEGDQPYCYDGETRDDGHIRVAQAAGLLVSWLALIAVASVVLMAAFPAASAGRIVFDVSSALGGVGLNAGFIGGDRPSWVLTLFGLLMWLGRLELFAVLYLFRPRAR